MIGTRMWTPAKVPRYVYDEDTKEVILIDGAEVIGHVVRRSRVRRGVKGDRGTIAAGTRGYFWTATPIQGRPNDRSPWWRPGDGVTIGTRFEKAEDAVAALLVFHIAYRSTPPERAVWTDEAGMRRWRHERKATWGF